MFIRFDRIHDRDKEADRQTDKHCMTANAQTPLIRFVVDLSWICCTTFRFVADLLWISWVRV